MKIKIYLLLIAVVVLATTILPQTRQISAEAGESFITYKLSHPLHEVESTSKNADCTIEYNDKTGTIEKVSVQVDVTTFDSGNSNRDSHAMEVIDALDYPEAGFTSSSVEKDGDSLKVFGKLTFHGVTKDIVIHAFEKQQENKLTVTGKFTISLTAFKVERPSLLLIPTSDDLRFSFSQTFNL